MFQQALLILILQVYSVKAFVYLHSTSFIIYIFCLYVWVRHSIGFLKLHFPVFCLSTCLELLWILHNFYVPLSISLWAPKIRSHQYILLALWFQGDNFFQLQQDTWGRENRCKNPQHFSRPVFRLESNGLKAITSFVILQVLYSQKRVIIMLWQSQLEAMSHTGCNITLQIMSGRKEDFYLWEFSKKAIHKQSKFLCVPLGLHSKIGSAAKVKRKQNETKM